MDWFLYDHGPRHERVDIRSEVWTRTPCVSVFIAVCGKGSISCRNLVFLLNRPGSVIVEFNITVVAANPKLDVFQPLREAVKSGKVGELTVDKYYFNIDPGIVCLVYFFSLLPFTLNFSKNHLLLLLFMFPHSFFHFIA